jgi:hypothetical protein
MAVVLTIAARETEANNVFIFFIYPPIKVVLSYKDRI